MMMINGTINAIVQQQKILACAPCNEKRYQVP